MEEEKKLSEPAEGGFRMELERLLNELLPEDKRTGNVEEMALMYIREAEEKNDRLVEALEKDPRLAQVLVDVTNGKSGASALGRYFGKEYVSLDEGTPEYDEFMAADAERMKEEEAKRVAIDEFNENFSQSMNRIDAFCSREGMNADEFRMKIEDRIITPILEGKFTDEVLTSLKKAVDYDKDTGDAYAAGEIAGRNMNINEMRSAMSDGMPKGLGTQAPPISQQPKRKRNPLIEAALNA